MLEGNVRDKDQRRKRGLSPVGAWPIGENRPGRAGYGNFCEHIQGEIGPRAKGVALAY
jgi:hypothetical protein